MDSTPPEPISVFDAAAGVGVDEHPAGDADAPGFSYSLRLVRPFVKVLRASGAVPDAMLGQLDAMDPDDRMPVEGVHRMLEMAVAVTRDPLIGLRAAREYARGDSGTPDYLVGTAATVEAGLGVAARYMRLVNDALDVRLDTIGDVALLRLSNRVALPRAARDFQMGSIHRGLDSVWAAMGGPSVVTVHLAADAPADPSEYTATFRGSAVEFGSAAPGFSFARRFLQLPLGGADSRLHDLIREHADQMLVALPKVREITSRVRDALSIELSGGIPTVSQVARRLSMGTRTLERRLDAEGTTFSFVLDDLRHRLALRHVAEKDLDLCEIATLLGFSQPSAFHRAFKRWTGQTPLSYRRSRHPR